MTWHDLNPNPIICSQVCVGFAGLAKTWQHKNKTDPIEAKDKENNREIEKIKEHQWGHKDNNIQIINLRKQSCKVQLLSSQSSKLLALNSFQMQNGKQEISLQHSN